MGLKKITLRLPNLFLVLLIMIQDKQHLSLSLSFRTKSKD